MTPLRGFLRFIFTKRIIKGVLPAVSATAASVCFILSIITLAAFVYRIGVPTSSIENSLFRLLCDTLLKFFIFLTAVNVVCSLLLKRSIGKFSAKLVYVLMLLRLLPSVVHVVPPYSWWETALNFIDGFYYGVFLLLTSSVLYISAGFARVLSANINPSKIIAFGFLAIISLGAGLLLLPNSSYHGVSVTDAFFVATSAVCVVGLTPFPINEVFTPMGQGVLLGLIQIGGVGIMTLTCFFVFLFNGNVSTYSQMSLRDAVSSNLRVSLVGILKRIFWTTVSVELAGAFLIWTSIHGSIPGSTLYKVWISVFHSISAFCNAGFSIFPENLGSPLLAGNNPFFIVISLLIVLGGLGFPVMINVLSFVWLKGVAAVRRKRVYLPFNLNSRLVLGMTFLLVFSGALLIALFEWNRAFSGLPVTDRIVQAVFTSVSPRTAGFSSIPVTGFTIQTTLLVIILMWIGGGAQSTAGGIKVNTLAVLFAGLAAGARRSDKIELAGRRISSISAIHALAVILLSITLIFASTIVILFMEPDLPPLNLFYEVVSAISTVGLSLDTTQLLGVDSKWLVMALMFVGRIGAMTVIWGMVKEKDRSLYAYPTENIIIN